jgi:hypothetical protein
MSGQYDCKFGEGFGSFSFGQPETAWQKLTEYLARFVSGFRELFGAFANSIEEYIDWQHDFAQIRRTGVGGQLNCDEQKLWLSRREEQPDYAFADLPLAFGEPNSAFGDFFLFGDLDRSTELIDIEEATVKIHKRRGTEPGIIGDVKRLVNSPEVTAQYYNQKSCGWILGVTSPGFTPELKYDLTRSLTFLGLDNMLEISLTNKGARSNKEVFNIIRREIVPAKVNVRMILASGVFTLDSSQLDGGDQLQ